MMTPADFKLVVLISGTGSNLQAIMDAIAAGDIVARIAAVISDKPQALGLQRAKQAGIATQVIARTDYADGIAFDQALLKAVDSYQPQLVVLAGFMRILEAQFVNHFSGRIINIHPSLLPRHKGLHTHRRALAEGDQEHGCSVHFVTPELDGGPLIAQARVPVLADDDEDRLAKRVLTQEHRLLPMVIKWYAQGRLQLSGQGPQLDGQLLPTDGWQLDRP